MATTVKLHWDTPFFVELVLLALTAPLFYFSARFPDWVPFVAFAVLAAGWLWRKLTIGIWLRRTPADWPLFFLLLVMLPVSVWAAPQPLRLEVSIPKVWILVWNVALFWVIVTHGSRKPELRNLCGAGFVLMGGAIALLALFGTEWSSKFPGFDSILVHIPRLVGGVFAREAGGFNSNVVAGSLLYILPFALAVMISAIRRRHYSILSTTILGIATGLIGLVFLASQSRGAVIGLTLGLAFMLLVNWRWGRWLLLVGTLAVVVGLAFVPLLSFSSRVESIGDFQSVTGAVTVAGRIEIWGRALTAIQDFSFSGMGLGTFSRIVPVLYPVSILTAGYDFGHAHNIFLQTALDFGIPGLISFLAFYLLGGVVVIRMLNSGLTPEGRAWALGLGGVLVAHTVFRMADSIAMGANNNFFFWFLFALIYAPFHTPAHVGTESAQEAVG